MPIFQLFEYGGSRHHPTARKADRAIPIEPDGFLAANHVLTERVSTPGYRRGYRHLARGAAPVRTAVRFAHDAVPVSIAHVLIGGMTAGHRRDPVCAGLGAGDLAVAVVIPLGERSGCPCRRRQGSRQQRRVERCHDPPRPSWSRCNQPVRAQGYRLRAGPDSAVRTACHAYDM